MRVMFRNENDLSVRFPILTQALANLPDETIIDGETVALDEKGEPSFSASILGSPENR
jgi:bifunctional non-homologous end joining protein LigD